jgi:PBP1b-binding outer membrane lipoprotein LpoB
MKKFYLFALLLAVLLTSCADDKTINGVTAKQVG